MDAKPSEVISLQSLKGKCELASGGESVMRRFEVFSLLKPMVCMVRLEVGPECCHLYFLVQSCCELRELYVLCITELYRIREPT